MTQEADFNLNLNILSRENKGNVIDDFSHLSSFQSQREEADSRRYQEKYDINQVFLDKKQAKIDAIKKAKLDKVINDPENTFSPKFAVKKKFQITSIIKKIKSGERFYTKHVRTE